MPRTALPKPEQVPADSKPTLDMFTKNIGFTPTPAPGVAARVTRVAGCR